MLKVHEPSAKAFQIFYLPVDGFHGTVGQTAVIDFSIPMFFYHDEGINNGILVFFEERAKLPENLML
jgi:hypothetical protein